MIEIVLGSLLSAIGVLLLLGYYDLRQRMKEFRSELDTTKRVRRKMVATMLELFVTMDPEHHQHVTELIRPLLENGGEK